ncbi:MAG: hypothetical protein P1R58_12170 [bacterium]|nr:hypothetical protein [bacterium]
MKSKLSLALLILSLLALLAAGCGKEADKTEGAEDEVTETASDMASAFDSVKEKYLVDAEKMVMEWNDKVSSLEEKKNALPELTQKPLEEPLKAVMASKATMDEKFNDLKGAGEENFDEQKAAFEGSVVELKTGYENLMGMF